MLKYLLLALVVVWLFYSPALRGRTQAKRTVPSPAPPAPPKPQAMVACAHCGVHLPQGDAVQDGHGQHYCSTAHRQAGPASH